MAAEEGEVAVAAHGGRGCCHGGSWRSGNSRVGRGARRRRSLRPGPRHGLGAGEHVLPASAGQRGRGRAGLPVRQQHERRRAAPALHAALRLPCWRDPWQRGDAASVRGHLSVRGGQGRRCGQRRSCALLSSFEASSAVTLSSRDWMADALLPGAAVFTARSVT